MTVLEIPPTVTWDEYLDGMDPSLSERERERVGERKKERRGTRENGRERRGRGREKL